MRGIGLYLLVLVIGAAVVAVPGYLGYLPGLKRDKPTTVKSDDPSRADSAKTKPDKIVALARLEPAGGILDLAGTPGDRVENLAASVGKDVKKDNVLITFGSKKLRDLEVEAANKQYSETKDRLDAERAYAASLLKQAELGQQLLEVDNLELAAQQTRVKSLASQAETAQRNYDRVTKLSSDITSQQQIDQVTLLRDQAANELASAHDQIEKLKKGRDLRKDEAAAKVEEARAGQRRVDATVPLGSLEIAQRAAQEKLNMAELKAPSDGRILEVHCDQGDAVGQLPLIRMGDVSQMVAIAEVYETQVRWVAVGAKAEFTAEAITDVLHGEVVKVGMVVGKNRMYSLDPTRNADLRVVEVRILLDKKSSDIAAKYVSLQVNAKIMPTDPPKSIGAP